MGIYEKLEKRTWNPIVEGDRIMELQIKALPEHLRKGVSAIADYGYLQVSDKGISIQAEKGPVVEIQKSKQQIKITYDTEPHFYMALARSLVLPDGESVIQSEYAKFGFQIDCSRNAVPRVDMIKRLVCLLVLAGYNYLQLYTEDTYELPDEPYFGYMRGRYTVKELKEIFSFAEMLGVEMVPCIQTLAHLKNLANFIKYYDHMDIDDILLVDDERTYELIRKMLSFWRDNFGSKRINIGLDEAFRLGRGKYIDRYGYLPKDEVYIRHLKRVFSICDEEGIEPEFWADGFDEIDLPTEQLQSLFNGNQTPVFWCYTELDAEYYKRKLLWLKEFAGKVNFAGGCAKWYGFAPNNTLSMKVDDIVFPVVKECGLDNVLMTTWGDNGDECSVFATIPSIWHAAQWAYPVDIDMDNLIRELTGYTKEEWICCDWLNTLKPEVVRESTAAKYMFYNDYLIGLLDENTRDGVGDTYKGLFLIFKQLADRDSQFAYIFQSYKSLCDVLTQKATFGKRLYASYHAKKQKEIPNYIAEITEIAEKMEQFYLDFRTLWLKENKGFGFEISDVRIGGMIQRAKSVKKTLQAYLDRDIAEIEELEVERLNYFGGQRDGEEQFEPFHNNWATQITNNYF